MGLKWSDVPIGGAVHSNPVSDPLNDIWISWHIGDGKYRGPQRDRKGPNGWYRYTAYRTDANEFRVPQHDLKSNLDDPK